MIPQSQTPIAPELQALLTLVQGAQNGAVSPATPDGQPTVAGQLMQRAAPQAAPGGMTPPGGMAPQMPQMQRNAGIAANIDMMKKQQAQQALMQEIQQRQQAQQPQLLGSGIAQAPGANNIRLADGGIVGYADGGAVQYPGLPGVRGSGETLLPRTTGYEGMTMSEAARRMYEWLMSRGSLSEMQLRKLAEAEAEKPSDSSYERAESRRFAAAPPPPTPPAPPPPGPPSPGAGARQPAPEGMVPQARVPVNDMMQKGIATLQGLSATPAAPVAPEDAYKYATEKAEIEDRYLRSRGSDPRLFESMNRMQQEQADKREALLAQRIAAEKERQKRQGWMDFVSGGAEGRTWQESLRNAGRAAMQSGAASRGRVESLEDAQLALQDARLKEQQLLMQAKYQIDRGDFSGAAASLAEAQKQKFEAQKILGQGQIEAGKAELQSRTQLETARMAANATIQAAKERTAGDERKNLDYKRDADTVHAYYKPRLEAAAFNATERTKIEREYLGSLNKVRAKYSLDPIGLDTNPAASSAVQADMAKYGAGAQ